MIEDVVVEAMTEEFILWRCLHGGPLSRDTIDQWPSKGTMPWETYRERNVPLLTKLTRTYGACAILARDADQIVGQLRFYPKAVWGMQSAGYLCLQQDHPAGPTEDFAEREFPPLEDLEDGSLKVHCLMTGSPERKENPYQRRGIGSRMARGLIRWARDNGWDRIEADSFEDMPIIYEVTGDAGRTFWEKLGFQLVDRYEHPYLREYDEFVANLEEQGKAMGIDPERARDLLVMRLDLT